MPTLAEWTSSRWPATSNLWPLANPQQAAIASEPIPTKVLARASGWAEPQNLSRVTNDFEKIQSYIAAAERGDTTMLYALWRDILCGDGHIQAEMGKRKMVVSGQPWQVLAADKTNPDDVQAAAAIKWMIEHCDNWDEGMNHLLDSSVEPKVAAEKIFEPYTSQKRDKVSIRFRLKKFEPVNYTLYNYLVAYIPQGSIGMPTGNVAPMGGSLYPRMPLSSFQNPAMIYNPDDWQADLRFYSVFPNGMVNRSWSEMYAPDPRRHIIHESGLFPGIRDNFGYARRPLVFWWFLGVQSRDWWARFMERYGQPFLKGKTDMQSVDAVANMANAFQQATKLSGIVIDRRDDVDIVQTMVNQGAQGYENFLNFCNKEKSKLILGHADASETPKGDGMKKGTGELVSSISDSYRIYDRKMLQNTLQKQLFRQFLDYNGFVGETPNIRWGGQDTQETNNLADTLGKLKTAGLQPTDNAIENISEDFGIELERTPEPVVSNAKPNNL